MKLRKKAAGIAAAVCLLLAVAAVTAAAVHYIQAQQKQGSTVSQVVNRVNLEFSGTQQTFSPEDGLYVAEILFTASKTEGDFYAVMNSASLSGMGYDRMEIVPAEDTPQNAPFAGAVLPAQDGQPIEQSWIFRIYFKAQPGSSFSPVLTLDYTSGVKPEEADRHLLEIPLQFIILDSAQPAETQNAA